MSHQVVISSSTGRFGINPHQRILNHSAHRCFKSFSRPASRAARKRNEAVGGGSGEERGLVEGEGAGDGLDEEPGRDGVGSLDDLVTGAKGFQAFNGSDDVISVTRAEREREMTSKEQYFQTYSSIGVDCFPRNRFNRSSSTCMSIRPPFCSRVEKEISITCTASS